VTVFRALAELTPKIIAAIEVEPSFMMEFLSLRNKAMCDLMNSSLNGADYMWKRKYTSLQYLKRAV